MAVIRYKDRVVTVTSARDKKDGAWRVRVGICHYFDPSISFASMKRAEEFGLEFAKDYIDRRTKTLPPTKATRLPGLPDEIARRTEELAREYGGVQQGDPRGEEIIRELSELCDIAAAHEAQKD